MILILGSGLTGLTTSYFLKKKGIKSIILEKESYLGGLCSNIEINDSTYERVQHLIHIRDNNIKDFIEKELMIPLNKYHRLAKIWFSNELIPYPFQTNLYKLPLAIRLECLVTFLYSKIVYFRKKNSPDISYKDWSIRTFGSGIAKHFMVPYNEKIWNFPADKLTTDWMGRLMPTPSFKEMIAGSIKQYESSIGYNSTFYYPQKGSISLLPQALYSGNVKLEEEVTSIDLLTKEVKTKRGNRYKYSELINTLPLPTFISLIKNCPTKVINSSKRLRSTSVHVLNITFPVNKFVKKFHWCYFPENKYKFYRIGIASNVSDFLVPKGSSSCYIEFNSHVFENNNEDQIVEETIDRLMEIGILKNKNEITEKQLVNIPYAYVIYDFEYKKSMATILKFLKEKDIASIGRYGAWEYSYIEKNIKDAINLSTNFLN